jgi:putative flippase GtrA
MALASNRLAAGVLRKARGALGLRFGRFALAAVAAFATSETVLTLCAGPFRLTSTWSSLLSWLAGAVVSYLLARWAWERKGRPNVLRETLPFWVISAVVIVCLTLATKFAYHASGWLDLHGAERVLFVDAVYGVANVGTFLLRFVFFHYVLFAGPDGRPVPAAVPAEVPGPAGPGLGGAEPFAMAGDSTGPMCAVRDDGASGSR